MFLIPCGDGPQRIRYVPLVMFNHCRWLGDVAILRYDHFYGPLNGTPKGIRFENGTFLPMDDIIGDTLKDGQHVWIILKGLIDILACLVTEIEDMEAYNMEGTKRKKVDTTAMMQSASNTFKMRPSTAIPKLKFQ